MSKRRALDYLSDIHHYLGINYEIVWKIAKEEIPGLVPYIEDILGKETS